MRFLKRLIIAVLVYIAVYLPFIAILQAVSGGDFTAAYSVGGIVGAVELALGSVIKITESKKIKKKENTEDETYGQDQLETEAFEPEILGGGRGVCDRDNGGFQGGERHG